MSLNNNSVLLGEEEAIQAAFLRHMLQQNGYNVTHVKQGDEAIKEIENNEYAFAVIGTLAAPDTVTTIKNIRQQEEASSVDTCSHTPIIALSTYSIHRALENLKKAGADHSLCTPVYKPDLDQVLEQITA